MSSLLDTAMAITLIWSFVVGACLSCRFSVLAIAFAAPLAGAAFWLATGSLLLGAMAFVAVQLGYLGPFVVLCSLRLSRPHPTYNLHRSS